jgi:hypothetical protein
VKKLVQKASREAWDQYVSTLEHDIHGRQNFVYKVIKHLNKEGKDTANIQVIKEEERYSFFKNLYTNNKYVHKEINPILIKLIIQNLMS